MEKHMHDHAEMLKTVRHELPKDEMLCDLADLFKLFWNCCNRVLTQRRFYCTFKFSLNQLIPNRLSHQQCIHLF